jgi:hypothetical protein
MLLRSPFRLDHSNYHLPRRPFSPLLIYKLYRRDKDRTTVCENPQFYQKRLGWGIGTMLQTVASIFSQSRKMTPLAANCLELRSLKLLYMNHNDIHQTIWNYVLHCLYSFFRMRISPVPLINLILNSKPPLRHLYIQEWSYSCSSLTSFLSNRSQAS